MQDVSYVLRSSSLSFSEKKIGIKYKKIGPVLSLVIAAK